MDDEAEGLPYLDDEDKLLVDNQKAYEEQRKKEEIAYKKQRRQEIKLACVQQAVNMWKEYNDINVIEEARKIYNFIRS